MTVILKNHKNGKERAFDDKGEAEETRSELIGIGAKPEDLEIIENGSEGTDDSKSQEGGQNPSAENTASDTNGAKEATVVTESEPEIDSEELHRQNLAQVDDIPEITPVEDKARSVIQNLDEADMTRLVWDPDASSRDVPYDPSRLPYDRPEPSAEAFDMFATIIEGEQEIRYSVESVEFTEGEDWLGCSVVIEKQTPTGTKTLHGVKTRTNTNKDHWRERLYSKARRNALKQDIPPTWVSTLLRRYKRMAGEP